jgi:predicted Zn-dependent peptidase
MPFHTLLLPNGLQLIAEQIPTSRSVALGFFVKTGSRDEVGPESGVSHFLEHMLFKGTPRRTALQVNLDFDRIGANYNAYTSEETTVYYSTVLPEYLEEAADILADILRPSLRQEDFDTEKQVILEEIKMYEDTPGSMAWDFARRRYYAEHPLGNSILGSTESITALTRDQMQAYFDRRYVTSNILVAVAGQFDWDHFTKLIQSKCGHWTDHPAKRTHLVEGRGPGGVTCVQQSNSQQQHVLMMSPSTPAEESLRYVAGVLAVAIGDESGSRLYWSLVDEGLVESAGCGSDHAQGSGILVSTFSCDPDQAVSNLAIVQKLLDDVQANGISELELQQAKNKIASRVVRYSERPMGRMRSIAGSWLYLQEYSDIDQEMQRFDAVTLASIREYLDRYPINQTTTLGYGPLAELA